MEAAVNSRELCRESTGRKREELFDIAKGIGIILVIIGHVYFAYFDSPFYRILNSVIFSFHMPFFFLISGYFLYSQKDRKNTIRHKAKQLLLPYLVTGIGMVLLSVIYDIMRGRTLAVTVSALKSGDMELFGTSSVAWFGGLLYGSAQDYESPFYIKGIGALWFLLALFVASIIVLKLGKVKCSYLYIALLVVAGLVTSEYIWLPFSIQAGMTASAYVYIGYKVKQHGKDIFTGHPAVKGILVLLWLFCVFSGQGMNMAENNVGLVSFLGSLGGVYVILLICRMIEKKCDGLKRALGFLGRYSLIIYCVHAIENVRLPWNVVFDSLGGIRFRKFWCSLRCLR